MSRTLPITQLIAAGESQELEFKASFDHAITIFSPGQLYGGLKLVELESDNYKSRLRNKLVAEAFYLTGNIEKYGSGFIRIRKALNDYPEIKFTAEEVSGGVALTFTQFSQQVTQQVTQQVKELLSVLDGEMSRKNLMDLLGFKDRNSFTINYLKPALDKGVIEMTHPEKPNSRLQKYRLKIN